MDDALAEFYCFHCRISAFENFRPRLRLPLFLGTSAKFGADGRSPVSPDQGIFAKFAVEKTGEDADSFLVFTPAP